MRVWEVLFFQQADVVHAVPATGEKVSGHVSCGARGRPAVSNLERLGSVVGLHRNAALSLPGFQRFLAAILHQPRSGSTTESTGLKFDNLFWG